LLMAPLPMRSTATLAQVNDDGAPAALSIARSGIVLPECCGKHFSGNKKPCVLEWAPAARRRPTGTIFFAPFCIARSTWEGGVDGGIITAAATAAGKSVARAAGGHGGRARRGRRRRMQRDIKTANKFWRTWRGVLENSVRSQIITFFYSS
jgi:hypothetical protein